MKPKQKFKPSHPVEQPQNWLFSFVYGHAHSNKYVKIYGSRAEAREEMFRRYGNKFAFQYPESEEQELKRNFMIELKE